MVPVKIDVKTNAIFNYVIRTLIKKPNKSSDLQSRKKDLHYTYDLCLKINAIFIMYLIEQKVNKSEQKSQFYNLRGEFLARQAQREVVKIKNLDFSYWASSTNRKMPFWKWL